MYKGWPNRIRWQYPRMVGHRPGKWGAAHQINLDATRPLFGLPILSSAFWFSLHAHWLVTNADIHLLKGGSKIFLLHMLFAVQECHGIFGVEHLKLANLVLHQYVETTACSCTTFSQTAKCEQTFVIHLLGSTLTEFVSWS